MARHYICLLFALHNPDLKIIGATFPVLALRLAGYLEQYADDLIHDLEKGEIANWLPLEPDLRASLTAGWSAAPQRAAQLRQNLASGGTPNPYLGLAKPLVYRHGSGRHLQFLPRAFS